MSVAKKDSNKNFWILLLCLLCGLTIGYFIGSLCDKVEFLKWMNYKGSFGFDQPIQLNLGVMWLSVQMKFNITISAIAGMLLGILLYKKL